MDSNYYEALSEYGLSDNEIKTYVTMLKIGEGTAQQIAKYSQLPRTTTYHLIESLIQKGLASSIKIGTILNFQAIKPERIIGILEEKKNSLKKIMPELSALMGTLKEKPKVTVFEGPKGIKAVLQDVLEENKIIYHYGDIVSLQNVLPYAFPQYISQRVKRKIPIQIICKKEEAHENLTKNAKKEYRDFKFIPDDYSFKTSVFIYANKVAIFNLNEEPYYVVVMENKDFYDTQKNFFELLWKSAKN